MNQSKIALITGASRGLGRALAKRIAAAGYHVYAGVRDSSVAEFDCPSSERISSLLLDITNSGERASAVTRINQEHGKLDLLIHNAGINSSSSHFGPASAQVNFGDLTEVALAGVALTNAVAPLLLTQELAELLRASGSSRVVAISSWFASIEESGSRDFNFGYTGSKALLNAYFRLAANALQPSGVITFMVNPGWMRTDMGGSKADRTPEQSADDIFKLVEHADNQINGAFVDWTGERHCW